MVAFRTFRFMDRDGGDRVSNRYFYDNFPQFTVETPLQRGYRWLLRRSTPKPGRGTKLPLPTSQCRYPRPGQPPDALGACYSTAGRPSSGNSAEPNVVTSAIFPSRTRSTSILNGVNSSAPGARW